MEDFKYNYKYKIIIPALYIANWILMFVGPFYLQVWYQKFCIIILIYLTFKSLIICLISFITFYKFRRTMKKA